MEDLEHNPDYATYKRSLGFQLHNSCWDQLEFTQITLLKSMRPSLWISITEKNLKYVNRYLLPIDSKEIFGITGSLGYTKIGKSCC